MKVLSETLTLECSAASLWNILSDVTRCDWVPTIDSINLEGDCRVFEMEGMGKVKERILLLDNESSVAGLLRNCPQNVTSGAGLLRNCPPNQNCFTSCFGFFIIQLGA